MHGSIQISLKSHQNTNHFMFLNVCFCVSVATAVESSLLMLIADEAVKIDCSKTKDHKVLIEEIAEILNINTKAIRRVDCAGKSQHYYHHHHPVCQNQKAFEQKK